MKGFKNKGHSHVDPLHLYSLFFLLSFHFFLKLFLKFFCFSFFEKRLKLCGENQLWPIWIWLLMSTNSIHKQWCSLAARVWRFKTGWWQHAKWLFCLCLHIVYTSKAWPLAIITIKVISSNDVNYYVPHYVFCGVSVLAAQQLLQVDCLDWLVVVYCILIQ